MLDDIAMFYNYTEKRERSGKPSPVGFERLQRIQAESVRNL
jgi:hypothetical protein